MNIEAQNPVLRKPYRHTVGRAVFEVTAYGNPSGTRTAHQLLLQRMERQLAKKAKEEQADEATESTDYCGD